LGHIDLDFELAFHSLACLSPVPVVFDPPVCCLVPLEYRRREFIEVLNPENNGMLAIWLKYFGKTGRHPVTMPIPNSIGTILPKMLEYQVMSSVEVSLTA
jgi:hypothetical protein